MTILLANDTSDVDHAGCQAVMSVLNKKYNPDHRIMYNSKDMTIPEDVTHVVVNGEGTMHHRSGNSIRLLSLLYEAQCRGLTTELVNSVWQCMDPLTQAEKRAICYLDVFQVREAYSQDDAYIATRRKPDIVLDASLSASLLGGVPRFGYAGRVVTGDSVITPCDGDLNLDGISWPDLVATLRTVSEYRTGRFHGICAAIRAGCEWSVRGHTNSHKIMGLCALMGRASG